MKFEMYLTLHANSYSYSGASDAEETNPCKAGCKPQKKTNISAPIEHQTCCKPKRKQHQIF